MRKRQMQQAQPQAISMTHSPHRIALEKQKGTGGRREMDWHVCVPDGPWARKKKKGAALRASRWADNVGRVPKTHTHTHTHTRSAALVRYIRNAGQGKAPWRCGQQPRRRHVCVATRCNVGGVCGIFWDHLTGDRVVTRADTRARACERERVCVCIG